MRGGVPPDLSIYRETIAVPIAITVTTLGLGAPPAGQRFRLWYWGIAMDKATGAAVGADFILRVAGGPLYNAITLLSARGDVQYFPGGFAWSTATAVSVQSSATAAASCRLFVGYTTEDVP